MTEQHQPTRMTRDLHLQQVLYAEVADMVRGVVAQGAEPRDVELAYSCAFDVQRPVAAWVLGMAVAS